jgi:hypothetical protein
MKLVLEKPSFSLYLLNRSRLKPYGIRIAKVKAAEFLRGVKAMNEPKIMKSAVLLNLLSHNFVAWTFIKLSAAYKYVGFFV